MLGRSSGLECREKTDDEHDGVGVVLKGGRVEATSDAERTESDITSNNN